MSDFFKNWDGKDTALTLQGVGALANAYGQYETNRKRNKLLKQQFDYAKEQDALAAEKQNKAQKNLDDAFSYSDLNLKKKKKKKSDISVDDGSVNV